MPYTIRTIELAGSTEDLLYPSFRKIDFDDSPAIVIVSTHLRYAWTARPGEDTSASALRSFIAANHNRSEEERRSVPQNSDTNDVHSPWRREIYYQWNHVFYDIANFLFQVGPGIGDIHPPAHDVLQVNYPIDCEGLNTAWDTNILLLPAHLQPGVLLRMAITDETTAERTIGTLDEKNGAQIWFVNKGTNVMIYVEGEYEKDTRGVAAVLVYGKLDTTSQDNGYEEYEAEDSEKTKNEENELPFEAVCGLYPGA